MSKEYPLLRNESFLWTVFGTIVTIAIVVLISVVVYIACDNSNVTRHEDRIAAVAEAKACAAKSTSARDTAVCIRLVKDK